MSQRAETIASGLEARLTVAKSKAERRELFRQLSTLYAGELHANAIKWAQARRMVDPIADGQQALSRAFILLAMNLDRLDFTERSLLYRFKGAIWSELGHLKFERSRRRHRSAPIDSSIEEPEDPRDKPQAKLESAEELEILLNQAETPAQRRLLLAGQLRASGYTWEEAAGKLAWEGSPESLRTSFSRLKREIRKRNDKTLL